MSKRVPKERPARKFENLRPDPKEDAERALVSLAFQRIAATSDGKIIFSWMRAQTIERSLGPDASDGALRALEGQRQFVRAIEGQISSGRRTPTES